MCVFRTNRYGGTASPVDLGPGPAPGGQERFVLGGDLHRSAVPSCRTGSCVGVSLTRSEIFAQ